MRESADARPDGRRRSADARDGTPAPAKEGRALSFGVVAEAYERFRPGSPAEVVDIVMTYAGQPVRNALEIGAGTGKATQCQGRASRVRVPAARRALRAGLCGRGAAPDEPGGPVAAHGRAAGAGRRVCLVRWTDPAG